jgi:hypothetical protein
MGQDIRDSSGKPLCDRQEGDSPCPFFKVRKLFRGAVRRVAISAQIRRKLNVTRLGTLINALINIQIRASAKALDLQ